MNNKSQKKKNEQKMIKDGSDGYMPKTDDDDEEDLDYNDLKTMKINKYKIRQRIMFQK